MTSDGDALFRAICAQPREDTPRLMYADWLEENGDPERAGFIRFQCEFPKWSSSHPRFRELFDRWERLQDSTKAWEEALPRPKGIKWWESSWDRGFIDAVTFANTKAFVENADVIFAASPVRVAEVCRVSDGTIERVLRSEYLPRLRQLLLLGPYGLPAIQKLSACAKLVNLESLCVWCECTNAGALALALSPYLGRLTTLSFSGHKLTDRGLTALIDSPALKSVTRLVLNGTQGIDTHMMQRLAARFGEVM